MVVYLVSEDEEYGMPTTEELALHAIENNLSFALLQDPSGYEGARFSVDSGIPSWSLFDRGPVVMVVDGTVEQQDVVDLL